MVHQCHLFFSFIRRGPFISFSMPTPAPREFQWFLRTKGETSLPREIILGATPVCFGRSQVDVDIVLRAPDVSRRHAQVQVDADGTVLLRDLKSSNGTRVNGLQVSGATTLRHGDEIAISRWRFQVQRVEVVAKVYKNRLPGMPVFEGAPEERGTDSTQLVSG